MEEYLDKINRAITYLEKLLEDNRNNHQINYSFIHGKIEGLKEARYIIEKEIKLKTLRQIAIN